MLALQASAPLAVEEVREKFPAVVFGAYNGQSQGTVLADVLFGRHNPGGRLSFTWFSDESQLPDIQNYGLTPAQTGGLGRTYQYFTTPDGRLTVHLDVTNTGTVPGATVAQVYATTPALGGVDLPARWLTGFQKTRVLRPGERQSIAIPIRAADLARYDERQRKQVVGNGRYRFLVGPDSATVSGSDDVLIRGRLTRGSRR